MTKRISVILNEVKNRIVTKGKPTAEILHFVQNVPIIFNQCVCFACGTNDKHKETSPCPLKRGNFFTTPCPPPPDPSKGGELGGELGGGNFTHLLVCYAVEIVHDFVDLAFYGGGVGGGGCGFGGEDLVD